jgi:acetylornithine deacetylase
MLSCGEESAEGDTIGARACVKRGYRAPFAIVCEPTSVELHTSTASLMCFELIVPGKAIHTCCRNQVIFPQSCYQDSGSVVGVDAVEKALPFLEMFYRLEKEWNHRWRRSAVGTGGRPMHDAQGIGAFNINPSFVEAGTYIAAVAGSMKVTYAVWYPPEIAADDILSEVRERVAALAQTDDWLRENPPVVNGPVSQLWPGFVTDENSRPVTILKSSYKDAVGRDPVISGFRAVCDGTFLADEGIPSVICGPGAINDGGHGYNEFVRRSEVIDAAKVYASFICDWCD